MASFPFLCIIQRVWYWRAIIIFIIPASFAEVAAAAVIIHIVKRKKCAKAEPAHGTCASHHTYFIFLASIIWIPVNNWVLIILLSSEKESLFWIIRQLTLKASLIYADFVCLPKLSFSGFLSSTWVSLCNPQVSVSHVSQSWSLYVFVCFVTNNNLTVS